MRKNSRVNIGKNKLMSSTRYENVSRIMIRVPHLGVVCTLLDDLRRHPEGRADEGVALAGRVGQLAGNAEVRELDVAHLRQQDVCGCKTTTDNNTLVAVRQQTTARLRLQDNNRQQHVSGRKTTTYSSTLAAA